MTFVASPAEQRILDQLVIPPQPDVLLRVAAEAKKPEPNLQVIADAIAADISIAGGVMQVINSAAYRRAVPISNISHAVRALGFRRVYSLVRTVALRNAMAHCPGIDSFWQSGQRVAEAAVRTAELLGRPDLVDHAYLCGLFHLVGAPVLAAMFPAYDAILTRAAVEGWSTLADEERQRFGTCHTAAGALVTQRWHLPEAVVEAIACQHEAVQLFNQAQHADSADLLAILKLARRVAAREVQTMVVDYEWDQLCDALADYLAVPNAAALEPFLDQIAQKMSASA